jgi:hypothetical protein
MLLLHSG